jgi:molecular chaperone GrpE
MQAKLERKDQQIEQIMEAYRGQKAETEKLRHRIEKTERRRFEQSKGDFIERFVEVLDNLDRAIDSIESAFDPDAVLQGIMLVRFRLVQLLKEEGLEKIFVKGQPFDPTHSEAAGMETVDDESQDGVVVKELERGYMLKGSLLRAARVVVGRYDGGGQSAATPKSGASSSSVPPESSSKPAGSNESSTAPDAGELPALPEFPEYQDVIENLEELELIELEPDPDPDPGPDTDTDTKTSSSDSASDSTTQAEREPSTRKEQAGATAWTNGESGSDEEAALDFTEDGLDFASKN